MERRLAAILAADVVGYSRLMEVDEVATRARFNGHCNELIVPTINSRRGRIVKVLGDGLLVELPSVVDAVECAVEIQNGMEERNAGQMEDERIDFRIGINVGDVIVEGDDIHGDGVNVAARIEALAERGGICISRSARDQIRDKLNFQLQDMGEVEVKNISRPVRVFKLISDQTSTSTSRKKKRVSTRRTRHAVLAIAAMAVVLATWLAFRGIPAFHVEHPPSLDTPRLSIAVLPFANLSGDKDQDYFADALTEDLTADLSRISGSFVISRNTAATYRGRNVNAKEVAQELNVKYLLEGTVRSARNSIRVGVQLTDGETGQQVWSERFEKSAGDMYTFQNEVTGRIARTLNLELKDAESRQVARGGLNNTEAADLALRAWAELWTRPQARETNDKALDYVNRALKIDTENSEANGVAAYAYARAATYGWGLPRQEALKLGITFGERSVQLDPKNADAVYALGFLYYLAGDTQKSQEQLRLCIELNRNHAPAYFFTGLNLIRLGRPNDAISWIERAFKLSPRDPLRSVWYGAIGRAQVLMGDDAKAIKTAKSGIAANPKHPHNYAVLASAYAHRGELNEAKTATQKFLQRQPGMTASRYWRNVASTDSAALKAYERLIVGLRKAGLPDS